MKFYMAADATGNMIAFYTNNILSICENLTTKIKSLF